VTPSKVNQGPLGWIDYLRLDPVAVQDYELYLASEINAARVQLDKAIDSGELAAIARFKGQREAFEKLLHYIRDSMDT